MTELADYATLAAPAFTGTATGVNLTLSGNLTVNGTTTTIDTTNLDVEDKNIITPSDDWKFEERLSKEFESVGFFISDHPLNQFKEIFNDYRI